jgi:hypothetical protein
MSAPANGNDGRHAKSGAKVQSPVQSSCKVPMPHTIPIGMTPERLRGNFDSWISRAPPRGLAVENYEFPGFRIPALC